MIEIKSFDTILTEMCDAFDVLISPKRISRSNTNIIYLLFKAAAKGFEIINNVCVVVYNKFDPAYCEIDDLNSVADIVGTERYLGSASGLHILVSNTKEDEDLTLPIGIYTYHLDADVSFEFEVTSPVLIEAGDYKTFVAMSNSVGDYPVTAQESITVETNAEVPDGLTFSCTDNAFLMGRKPESDLEFRKRVLSKTDRQFTVVELETEIKNLPYVFDCQLKFNPALNPIEFDGYEIPPKTALMFISGEYKNEIAEKFASKLIAPTLQTATSIPLYYNNHVFAEESYVVWATPFTKLPFDVNVTYKIDLTYNKKETAEEAMIKALRIRFVTEVHEDYVKEEQVYETLSALMLEGVNILSVQLSFNGSPIDYLEVPLSSIAEIDNVTFTGIE